jgi:flagellar biosynthesis/type III secretory pathway M-ring protein FliF/YscJ
MGMFTSKWERAHRSLNGFSSAQRVAAGMLMFGIAAAGYWMTRTSSAVMVPVLDQPFATADVVQIAEHLTQHKVSHEIRDGKVYVPSDRRLEVLSELIYSDTLIGNTESGFDAMVKQTSVFDTPAKTDKMFNHARQVMLQGVISRFRGVRKATVIIDPSNDRHIGGQSVTPSALVDIQTRGDEANPRQLATAAINAVTGAVSSMSRERVKVTIDGASYNLGIEDIGGDFIEQRQRCEQAYVTKVRELLKFIPDVLVSVSVDMELESVTKEKHTTEYATDALGQPRAPLPPTEISEAASAVLANAVPGDEEDAKQAAKAPLPPPVVTGETVEKRNTPAGKVTVLSASVVVPRSYLVQIYQTSVTKKDAPSDALLQPVADARLATWHRIVANNLGLKDSAVTVDMYDDAAPQLVTPSAPQVVVATRQEAGAVTSLTKLWNGGRQWGIWVIGGATLLIASMMFRRGSTAMAMPQPAPHPTPRPRMRDDDFEDEDEEDAALMRQVRDLASARPEETARVLRDWIHQS